MQNYFIYLGKVCLPPQIKLRYTLVLDLDETLVHCSVESIGQPDLTFPVTFNGVFYQVYVRKRPFLDFFLETVSRNFEVIFVIFYSLLNSFFVLHAIKSIIINDQLIKQLS